MATLKARVRKGRLVLDEATDLPEGTEVELVPAGAEEIPFADRTFDTVLVTYALCTIPDPVRAAREMARVLAPDGSLLFCEHGLAPDASVRRWQRRVNPLWRRVAGGCNLDRDVPALLREGGFEPIRLEATYLPGWRPATFHYWGEAEPRPGSGDGRTWRGERRPSPGVVDFGSFTANQS